VNPESKTDGIINEILHILKVYSVDDDFGQLILNILENVKVIRKRLQGDKEAEFYVLRKLCLKLSNMLRTPKKSTGLDWQGLSDILYFYSLTFTYFTSNDFYTQVQSEKEVTVRKCDLPDFTQYFTKRDVSAHEEAVVLRSDMKTYPSSYIWAQMSIWWKQTLEKPEQSLTTEKRGTLTYPTLTPSFVDVSKNSSKEFEYPHKTRENWLKKIIEAPYEPWPVPKKQAAKIVEKKDPMNKETTEKAAKKKEPGWNWRNTKMFGSFLFDCIREEEMDPELPKRIVEVIDKSDQERFELFEELNWNYFKDRIKERQDMSFINISI